jgi:ribose 5-phosphate isomerase B
MIKILIGADHGGYNLKEKLVERLRSKGFAVEDIGYKEYEPTDDFPEIAFKLGEKVVFEKAKGILICSSGIGMSIAANKVKGVRAGLCTSIKQARLAKSDNDINVLCLANKLVSIDKNFKIVIKFINTVFSCEERYIRRIKKIKNYES